MRFWIWLAGFSAASAVSVSAAATLSNIRIARHPAYVRIVLDLDAPITFAADGDAFTLTGLDSESAILNARPAEAPLKRVMIAPAAGGARLSFETQSPVTPKAFTLPPDADGGHRLVIDLYPAAGETTPAEENTSDDGAFIPPPSGVSAALPGAFGRDAEQTAVPGMPPALDVELPAPAAAPPAGPGYSQETLRAERALDRGDAPEACRLAESALKTDSDDLRALAVLGGCRLAQQDGAGAKSAYVSALVQDPSYVRARIGLATAEDMLGNHAAARAELSKVLGHQVPPEELARLIDAFKTLKPADARAATAAAEPDQRAVGTGAAPAVRGPPN